jgi:hypothetical protein
MRFPWQKPKRNGYVKSRQAVLDAAGALKQVQSRNPEVHAVSKTLKDIRERNHFAEQLQIILGGR